MYKNLKRAAVWTAFLFLLVIGQHSSAQVLGNPTAVARSTATENSHVFDAAPGYLYSLGVTTSGTAGYAMLFDAVSAPSNGAVTPVACYAVAANSTGFYQYGSPFPFGTGITAVFSTTGCATLTLSATAFFFAQVR